MDPHRIRFLLLWSYRPWDDVGNTTAQWSECVRWCATPPSKELRFTVARVLHDDVSGSEDKSKREP